MSDIVWAIDPRRDSLQSVLTRLRQLASGLCEPAQIEWSIVAPAGDLPALTTEQRRHLFLILKEALHNVVRHAAARHVTIAVYVRGHRLAAEVRDDGHGFIAP